MTNLDYIYILENMLVKWKVSLRDLIRQVIKLDTWLWLVLYKTNTR
ncbi:MAG: hypothetical protein K2L64_02365 [Ureaplasma sp.]|nr:hypothetical protein [Ureaplasma sp.]